MKNIQQTITFILAITLVSGLYFENVPNPEIMVQELEHDKLGVDFSVEPKIEDLIIQDLESDPEKLENCHFGQSENLDNKPFWKKGLAVVSGVGITLLVALKGFSFLRKNKKIEPQNTNVEPDSVNGENFVVEPVHSNASPTFHPEQESSVAQSNVPQVVLVGADRNSAKFKNLAIQERQGTSEINLGLFHDSKLYNKNDEFIMQEQCIGRDAITKEESDSFTRIKQVEYIDQLKRKGVRPDNDSAKKYRNILDVDSTLLSQKKKRPKRTMKPSKTKKAVQAQIHEADGAFWVPLSPASNISRFVLGSGACLSALAQNLSLNYKVEVDEASLKLSTFDTFVEVDHSFDVFAHPGCSCISGKKKNANDFFIGISSDFYRKYDDETVNDLSVNIPRYYRVLPERNKPRSLNQLNSEIQKHINCFQRSSKRLLEAFEIKDEDLFFKLDPMDKHNPEVLDGIDDWAIVNSPNDNQRPNQVFSILGTAIDRHTVLAKKFGMIDWLIFSKVLKKRLQLLFFEAAELAKVHNKKAYVNLCNFEEEFLSREINANQNKNILNCITYDLSFEIFKENRWLAEYIDGFMTSKGNFFLQTFIDSDTLRFANCECGNKFSGENLWFLTGSSFDNSKHMFIDTYLWNNRPAFVGNRFKDY